MFSGSLLFGIFIAGFFGIALLYKYVLPRSSQKARMLIMNITGGALLIFSPAIMNLVIDPQGRRVVENTLIHTIETKVVPILFIAVQIIGGLLICLGIANYIYLSVKESKKVKHERN
jgi:heme/copper-type cytochrome/quinol oxidase subunit 3